MYGAWLVWFLSVALVTHFTLTRALSGEFAYWCTALLAVSAGVLSAPTLISPPRVLHLLILVPVWLFGAWFSLLSLWFPRFGFFEALQMRLQGQPILGVQLPTDLLLMLPYLLTVIALMGLLGRMKPPSDLGN